MEVDLQSFEFEALALVKLHKIQFCLLDIFFHIPNLLGSEGSGQFPVLFGVLDLQSLEGLLEKHSLVDIFECIDIVGVVVFIPKALVVEFIARLVVGVAVFGVALF